MSAVIYEVNLFVQRGIEREYRNWLAGHIREILSLPGFVGAQLFEVHEPLSPADQFALCVHYHLGSDEALQDYFREHAPRLRAEGLARFGNGFRAQRRVLAATNIEP